MSVDAELYPESAKLLAVKDESQALGDFLEWLWGRGIELCKRDKFDNPWPIVESFNTLLAEYFEIDLAAKEKEVRAMLGAYQASQRDKNLG